MVTEFTHTEKHYEAELRFDIRKYVDNPRLPDLLFLHGFMGSGMQFRHLFTGISDIVNPITADISIPGPTHSPAGSLAEPLSRGIHQIVSGYLNGGDHFDHPFVAGYSMGGRLALSWATRFPGHLSGLILESTTAGIFDEPKREQRRIRDAENADRIRADFPAFLNEWEKNPLFQIDDGGSAASVPRYIRQKKDNSGTQVTSGARNRLETIQRSQHPETAAAWLEGFGAGVMPPVWDQLDRIRCPVIMITGRMDSKFCDIAGRMTKKLPDAHHTIVPDAAHRVHIDSPDHYISTLRDFLNTCGTNNKIDFSVRPE